MDILNNIINFIVNPLVYLLFGVAVILFLWGVFNFVRNADNSEKRLDGGRHILWGVIGIAIMISVFTFMHIIKNTVGTVDSNVDPYPASLR